MAYLLIKTYTADKKEMTGTERECVYSTCVRERGKEEVSEKKQQHYFVIT